MVDRSDNVVLKSSNTGDLALLSSLLRRRLAVMYIRPVIRPRPRRTKAGGMRYADAKHEAMQMQISRRKLVKNRLQVIVRRSSMMLKSAVNLFKIRPVGTVSSHRRGTCMIVKSILWKSALLARTARK